MKALSIKEILEDDSITSNYQGSEKTREMVQEQIKRIYGKQEVRNYDPFKTFTFAGWLHLGYRPKKGSKALKSITYVEKKDAQGNVIEKYPRKINLFYYRAVEPINAN